MWRFKSSGLYDIKPTDFQVNPNSSKISLNYKYEQVLSKIDRKGVFFSQHKDLKSLKRPCANTKNTESRKHSRSIYQQKTTANPGYPKTAKTELALRQGSQP